VAGLFKYQSVLAGCAWAVIVFMDRQRSRKDRAMALTALLLGFLAVAIPYVASFRWLGIWGDFYSWGWKFNLEYIGALSWPEVLGNAIGFTSLNALFWAPLLLSLTRPTPGTARIALPWLATMACAIAIGGRFYGHYYLMALPPLCLLAALGYRCLTTWRGRVAHRVATIFSIVSAVAAIFRPDHLAPNKRRYDDAQRQVAEWIRSHSDSSDRIFIWGNSPEIYYFANREMGTRFPFCNYHVGKIWGTHYYDADSPGSSALAVPRAWTDLMEDLERSRPLFFVDTASGGLKGFGLAPFEQHLPLAQFISRHYAWETTIDGVRIYRAVGSAAASRARTCPAC
jgi:hypothetical protein